MSKEKKTEIPYTQKPEYKYQVTLKYMYDYVDNCATPEEQLWFCDIVDNNKTEIERGGKKFKTTDIEKVRSAFIEKFFGKDYFEAKRPKKKDSFQGKIDAMRAKALAALKK